MNKIIIETIDELLKFIKKLNQIHQSMLWYRGVENANWELLPSIQRSARRIALEKYLTNGFYIKTKQILDKCPDKKNYAAWMSLMQHYGLPTRLMDWSQSPLVAVFFATETCFLPSNCDACVWVLVPDNLNIKEGFGKCSYPVDAETVQEMLLPAFKERGINSNLEDKIIACHSTENNLRMYSQQASFTVHNSLKKLEEICDEDTLYKIIIPAKRKKYFLESLQIFGITESYVYPDLDHISKDLKKQYDL